MAYINVSGTGDFATLCVSKTAITTNTGTGVLTVPSLQNITVNNGNGVFRWKQLDSTSEKAIAIAATNQISLNIVLDDTTFFGDSGASNGTVAKNGLFKESNDKSLLYFRVYWSGVGAGDKYVEGTGYITGLAPTVSADQPVWVSPLTIEVVGDFTTGSV